MPKTYTVKDNTTNKTVTFQWNGDGEPSDADIESVFADVRSQMRQPGFSTIGDQVAAKGGIQAMRVPPKFNAAPGGRGTSMDSRFVSDELQGAASVVPFTGAEAPDNAAGRIGQGGMTAAMLAGPAARIASAATSAMSAGSKVAAIAKAALSETIAPLAKFEATKTALEYMGVPSGYADAVAFTVSGVRPGRGPAQAAVGTATAEPEAARSAQLLERLKALKSGAGPAPEPVISGPPATRLTTANAPRNLAAGYPPAVGPGAPPQAPPVAAAPVEAVVRQAAPTAEQIAAAQADIQARKAAAPAPWNVPRGTPAAAPVPASVAAPVAPPKTVWIVGEADAPAWLMEGAKQGERRILSPQAVRQGVALAARRAKVALNATQSAAADALVKSGADPAEAVKQVAGMDAQAALLKLPGFVSANDASAAVAERIAAGPRGKWGPIRERQTR